MTNLFDPPNIFALPLSKGADLFCTFVYKPLLVNEGGDPILDGQGNRQYVESDYPAGATVALVIDTADPATPITVDAAIDGSTATVWADKDIVDAAVKGKLWRAVLTFENGLDVPLCNGRVVRYDGKPVT